MNLNFLKICRDIIADQKGKMIERSENNQMCESVINIVGVDEHFSQLPEICMAAVKENGLALQYIERQTPELCMAAVQQNGYAIEYVKDPTPELCVFAVKCAEMSIECINPQNFVKMLLTAKQNKEAAEFFKTFFNSDGE